MSTQIEAEYDEIQLDINGLITVIQREMAKHAKEAHAEKTGVTYSHVGEMAHVKEQLKNVLAFLAPSGTHLETLQEIDQALDDTAPDAKPTQQDEAQAALLDHLREYGSLEGMQRECTQSPWWAIIDEDRLKGMLKTDPDDVCHAVAHSVAGPYFSRAMAQNYLDKLGRKFHDGAKVYCLGAMNAPEWTWFADRCKELAGIDLWTGKRLETPQAIEDVQTTLHSQILNGSGGVLIDTKETL